MKILHHALNTAQRHVFSRKFYIHLWKANFVIGCDRREANAIITLARRHLGCSVESFVRETIIDTDRRKENPQIMAFKYKKAGEARKF